jgi:phosphoglycerate-specific signal transduction histidine kinase
MPAPSSVLLGRWMMARKATNRRLTTQQLYEKVAELRRRRNEASTEKERRHLGRAIERARGELRERGHAS